MSENWYIFTNTLKNADRAVARALIGRGGGVLNIHIFMLCAIDFFWNQLDLKRNQSRITWKYEYSPPPLN